MAGIRKTAEDYIIDIVTYIVYIFFAFVCVYPFYYILINILYISVLIEKWQNQEIFFSVPNSL